MTELPTSPSPAGTHASRRTVIAGAIAMALVVYASNRLVVVPINDWLTWGAFTYPLAFLVTDLVNRLRGPAAAMKVVLCGFALGVVLSFLAGDPRIALASGIAFLAAQSLDVGVFDRLRHRRRWWLAPGVSSALGSVLDTALFFSIAFAGTGVAWVQLGVGDLGVKLAMALAVLLPYRWLAHVAAAPRRASALR